MPAATSTTSFSDIHPDIISSHIIPRLDGRTLAALTSTSTSLRSLTSLPSLWSHICHTTWPSTSTPHIQQLISTFPNGGPISFYSLVSSSSSSSLHNIPVNPHHHLPSPLPAITSNHHNLNLLISAVDIFYRQQPILSKTNEIETHTTWFKSAPFRIDLLDPKETIHIPILNPKQDQMCVHLYDDLELSWIVIDPIRKRAVNIVSSGKPVEIHRHWLTGEVQAKFVTVIGRDGSDVAVTVEVTCGGRDSEEMMFVREVGMEVEGIDGVRLSGGDSLEVLMMGFDDECRKKWKKEDGRKRYERFMEMRRERKERKVREYGSWDLVCVAAAGVLGTAVSVTAGYFGSFWR